jgi:hypothetical protein
MAGVREATFNHVLLANCVIEGGTFTECVFENCTINGGKRTRCVYVGVVFADGISMGDTSGGNKP